MEDKILKKSYKILGLSLAIFALTLFFFLNFGKDFFQKTEIDKGGLNLQPLSSGFSLAVGGEEENPLSKMPGPENFRTFSYPETKTLKIEGECAEAYYAILVYESGDDYRKNPAGAFFNKAFTCKAGEKINYQADLSSANLVPGSYYYFLADEGEGGGWHNPR